MTALRLPVAQLATLACLMEVSSPKVGNVHRGSDFHDLTFYDFTTAAVVIGPAIARAAADGVGTAVLEAVQATQQAATGNVNLGIAMLLAPLAAAIEDETSVVTKPAVARVLANLTPTDSDNVYAAIQLAQPGGMGQVDAHDVSGPAPPSLLDAMQLAAERDMVAREYATDFDFVLGELSDTLAADCAQYGWVNGVRYTHLKILAERSDSLILRKSGPETAEAARAQAARAVDSGAPGDDAFWEAVGDLDFWMRSDGKKRNPGATADLIAAAIFVLLNNGRLDPAHATLDGE